MPDATFALVGPEQTDVARLRQLPEHPPARVCAQHQELPRYVKGFDVGIVPYRLTEYTANVYPTKLNEYLAMGIPVVATDLPEIRRFNAEHGDDRCGRRRRRTHSATAIRDALAYARTTAGRARASRSLTPTAGRAGSPSMQALIDEGDRAARRTSQRWDETLRRVYRRTRTRIARAVIWPGRRLSAGVQHQSSVVERTAAVCRKRRRRRPTRLSSSPAASANPARPAAARRSGSAGRSSCIEPKYAPVLILSSGYVYSFHEAGRDARDGRSIRACPTRRSCSSSMRPTPIRT